MLIATGSGFLSWGLTTGPYEKTRRSTCGGLLASFRLSYRARHAGDYLLAYKKVSFP